MSMRLKCPNCDGSLQVEERKAGQHLHCPLCQAVIAIPSPPDTKQTSRPPKLVPSQPKQAPRRKVAAVAAPHDERAESVEVTSQQALGQYQPLSRRRPARSKKKKADINWPVFAGGGVAIVFLAAGITWGLANRQSGPATTSDSTTANAESQTRVDRAIRRSVSSTKKPPTQSSHQSNKLPKAADPEPINHRQAALRRSEKAKSTSRGYGLSKRSASKVKLGNSERLPLEELIDRFNDGVVLISTYDSSGRNTGIGSGFLVDSSGLVATNYHVIRDAVSATARFRDETQVKVSGVRAWDVKRDLAIIQLKHTPPQAEVLSLGPAEPPRQGADVITIGHPQGLQFTTTKGIVNAVHSTRQLPEQIRRFLQSPDDQLWLQTSAMITRGNSGGPLLNARGEVVGINTWVMTDTNFGFASHVRHLATLMEKVGPKLTPLNQMGGRKVRGRATFANVDPRVEKIVATYELKRQEFVVQLERAKTVKQTQNVLKSKNPARKYASQLVQFSKHSSDAKAAFQALFFAIDIAGHVVPETGAGTLVKQASERLLSDHLDEKDMDAMALAMVHMSLTEARKFLRELSKKSPHKDVRGIACFALAQSLMLIEKPGYHTKAEIIATLDRIEKEYSDVEMNGQTLGEIVKPLLFAKKHLAIGKKAPDIVGTDREGYRFRLSDYNGKVIMLDFWADWNQYCSQMYPYERLLSKQFKNQPFVLLGVNLDEKQRLKSLEEEGKVTWRSWWDGPDGKISKKWNISGIPNIYLIDHQGIIRHHFDGAVGTAVLDRAIEELMEEAGAKPSNRFRNTRKRRSR